MINRNNCFNNQVISNWSSLLFWPQQAVRLVSDAGHRQHAYGQQFASWRLCELHAHVHSLQLTVSSHMSTCAEMIYLLSNISRTLALKHWPTGIKCLFILITKKDAKIDINLSEIFSSSFRQARLLLIICATIMQQFNKVKDISIGMVPLERQLVSIDE